LLLSSVSPALSALKISPHKFSIKGRRVKGRCVKQTRKNKHHRLCTRKVKQKVSYTVNVAASVTVKLQLQTNGRKIHGRCVKQTRKNRKHKHCKLTKGIATITASAKAGANNLTISRKLKPGSYKLAVTASANGHTTTPQTVSFKVTG
ncbi:MAG: hypothetical protein JOZ73_11780, partial [Solirubrobacterales bacterium]|nr:hypothetical protein [Solirubrobacterales bacterium]